MDTERTDGVSIEQLREWLNRPHDGRIHGCMMANLDNILKLAIEAMEQRET